MSKFIKSREHKQKILKELIMELHDGKSIAEVKARFNKLIEGVTSSEIAEMEEALIKEGMLVENIQALSDAHFAVFKGSIEEIRRVNSPLDIPGHPLHTLNAENKELQNFTDIKLKLNLIEYKRNNNDDSRNVLIEDLKLLLGIDKHYKRKEYLIFPVLEKYGITAPPQVMRGIDDEIRECIKKAIKILSNNEDKELVISKIEDTINKMIEMIYKEKNILFPLTIDYFTDDQWANIYDKSDDIGYFLIESQGEWLPNIEEFGEKDETVIDIE